MRIGSQVYARGSLQAVEDYCKAFGLTVTFSVKNDEGTEYCHCELSKDGQLFMAVSEAPSACDSSPKTQWQTMAFNVYEMGSEEAVRTAFDVLSAGGTVIDPVGPCPWNDCCANVVDKYGVFWWIAK